MSNLFDVSELVRIAVEDEKSGVAFYTVLAEKATHPTIKQAFTRLAEEERGHYARFQKMLDGLGDYKPRETYSGEYMDYLRTMLTDRAFPDEAGAVQQAKACEGDLAALALATRFERETLLLMSEMRGMVPDKDRSIVDELAREEQSHLVELGRARGKLTG